MAQQPLIAGLILTLLAAGAAWGQRYSFKHYGQESGLTTLEILALLQDRDGFLWVGTENGLYRYDGRHFRLFTTADGLPSMQIHALAEGRDGTLWVGAIRGVARRVGDRFEKVDMGRARGTRSIVADFRGRLLIGSEAGLVVGNPLAGPGSQVQFQLYPNPPPQGPAAYAVAVDAAGKVWYACGQSVCLFDDSRVTALADRGVPSDAYTGVVVDRKGNVWVRSLTRLIELPAGGSRFVAVAPHLPPSLRLATLYADHGGNLLVPTVRGLGIRDAAGAWSMIGRENGLPGSNVRCALEDREGSLWIGCFGDGLVRWRGRGHWESWTEAEGLSDNVVWGILRDHAGRLWAGTESGLSRFDGQTRRWTPWYDQSIKSGRTLAFAAAADGTTWVGRYPGGILEIDSGGHATAYGNEHGLISSYVSQLALDARGHLWAGTQDGLFEGVGGPGHKHFEKRVLWPEKPQAPVMAMARDGRGRLWSATWYGLYLLERDRWRRFTTQDGLRSVSIEHLAGAADGVWIGYAESLGISHASLDGTKLRVRHFSQADGMGPGKPLSIAAGPSGQVWVGTDRGLERFDGRQWFQYDKSDGLVWNDCDADALFADADGSVWIGTAHGLSHFVAQGAPVRPAAVPIAITGVRLGNIKAASGDVPSVPYSARAFHVTFAALSFINEASVTFRYRLAGVDSGWIETEDDEARYPALWPGQYEFEVQARALDSWKNEPARFSFRIRPPWWLNWWAILGEIGLAYTAVRLLLAWRWRSILNRQAALERAVEARTRELTQQKAEIERLLHASREAARLKDEFLANISHEIRTPLNGIMGMTDLVLSSELKEDQAECLRLVKVSGDSLLSVINDILDYSKIEAGKLDLDTSEFPLHDLLRDTSRSMEVLARNKGLALECGIAPEVPPMVVGDPIRLGQVLVNLIGNAIKFTSEGWVRLQVSVAPAPGNGRSAGHDTVELLVAVEDTGIGIPEDKQQVIFEPFRQADGSTSRRFGGTGLGLAISARLAAKMGGRIWVESRPGAGTVFYFTASLGVAEIRQPPAQIPSAPEKEPAPASPRRSLRILLAEDNPVNQKLGRRVLENGGHQVVCVNNGLEAVAMARQEKFDIVLMDVQMPAMDGFEATLEIRKLDAALRAHTPILALTANAMKGDRERCLGAGMDGYVPKPLKPDQLLKAIQELTGL